MISIANRLEAVCRLARASYRAPALSADASGGYAAATMLIAEMEALLSKPVPNVSQSALLTMTKSNFQMREALKTIAGFTGPTDQSSRKTALLAFLAAATQAQEFFPIGESK